MISFHLETKEDHLEGGIVKCVPDTIFNFVNYICFFIYFQRITEKQKKVVITDRMWARLLSSTNQPSFLSHEFIKGEETDLEEHYHLDDEYTLCNGSLTDAIKNM